MKQLSYFKNGGRTMKDIFYENYISCDETLRLKRLLHFPYLKVKEGRRFLMGRNCGMLFKIFEKSFDREGFNVMRCDAIRCDGSEIG